MSEIRRKITHLLAVLWVVGADIFVVGSPAPVENEDGQGPRGEDHQPGLGLRVARIHQAQHRAEQDQTQTNIQVPEIWNFKYVSSPAPVEDEDGQGPAGEDHEPYLGLRVACVHPTQHWSEQHKPLTNIQVPEIRNYKYLSSPAPVQDEDGQGPRGEDHQPGLGLQVARIHQAYRRAEQELTKANIQVPEIWNYKYISSTTPLENEDGQGHRGEDHQPGLVLLGACVYQAQHRAEHHKL